MKIKKLLAIILALSLCAMLFACNKSDDQTSEDPAAPATSDSPAAPETSNTPAAPATSDTPSAPTNTQPSNDPGVAEETPDEPGEKVWPDGPPLKIGHICDLTGVESSTGLQASNAFAFAVKAIGGKIAGRTIEIIELDSQSNPSAAADVARQMVEVEGVAAIFGPTQIGHKSAVSEYIKEAGIPLIFYNGTPAGLFNSNPWLVGSAGTTVQLPTVMADYVYNEMGYRTIHTLSMDNTGGHSWIDPFVESFENLGGQVLSQQWHPVPCADFAPYLVNLSEADALVCWTSSADAIAFWGSYTDLGIAEKMPVVAAFHGGFTDFFVPMALSHSNPSAAANVVGTVAPIMYTYSNDSPENKAFVDAWTEEFGSVPPGSNMPGDTYQALLLFKYAVESLDGDTDPDKLIEALFAANFTGPGGHLYFDNSHAATKDVYIVQVVQMPDDSYNYDVVKTYKDVPPSGLVP